MANCPCPPLELTGRTTHRKLKLPSRRGPGNLPPLRHRLWEPFVDFAASKSPGTNEERYLVAIYYLQHVLELANINRNHVFTAFKNAGWKAPLDIDSGMRMTSARQGWIDQSDRSNLKTSIAGENYIEHDMPRQKAKK